MENSTSDALLPSEESAEKQKMTAEDTQPLSLSQKPTAEAGMQDTQPVASFQAEPEDLGNTAPIVPPVTNEAGYAETTRVQVEPQVASVPTQAPGASYTVQASSEINETIAMNANPTNQSNTEPTSASNAKTISAPKTKKGSRWGLVTLLGIAGILLVGALSAWRGYVAGIDMRKSAEATQITQRVQEQFDLGVQEMADKQYFRARQRFEYVIKLDPDYPGATEKLAEVMLELNITPTPTPTATPVATPTPDLSGVQQLMSQSQQYLANSDWTNAIDSALKLRQQDPNYEAVAIDGILFIALRNRGVDKILKNRDLEGGMYDLKQAAMFGPLDAEAEGYMNWATLYITGASFWELDWKQAVFYLSQVAASLPNLTDGSGMSASERYRQALIGYGNTLMQDGDFCTALEQYQLALTFGSDQEAENGVAEALPHCGGETEGEEGTAAPANPIVQPPQ